MYMYMCMRGHKLGSVLSPVVEHRCRAMLPVHMRAHTQAFVIKVSIYISAFLLSTRANTGTDYIHIYIIYMLCSLSTFPTLNALANTDTNHGSECVAWGYESVGYNCHPERQCKDDDEDCCGQDHSKDGKN